MAAVFLYIYAAFVMSCRFLSASSSSEHYLCPSTCSCLGSMVDCSKRGLIQVPSDLPLWVTILELQSNDITEISQDVFLGLEKLEQLDLSNNQISNINTTVFRHLPALKELKLAYNHLSEIPVIGRNSSLTHLVLHHNQIHSINGQALEGLPKLRTLDLNFNRIVELTPGTFPEGTGLHQLFLNNNKIISLDKGSLDNLTSLEWLKINKNKLSQLPKDLFKKLSKLKYLELNRNKFKVIEGLSFHGLENLHVLKLRRNQVTQLMDGAFWGLSKIQNLQLDYNNISGVNKGWLYGLNSLQQLSLSHNNITNLEADGWEFCPLLWELDLSQNRIQSLLEGAFEKLTNLKYIYLSHNKVSYIEDGAFRGLANLQILEMKYNDISWTIEDMNGAFEGLENLNRLGLDSNRIKSIAKRAFSGLEELKQLHLTDNAITSIQGNAFSVMKNLQELKLNSTNLLCDCKLQWLPQWLRAEGFETTVKLECAHPEWLKGKSIFSVAEEDFKCKDFPKPIIISEPKSQIALKGDNLTLECTAASSSNSPMSFQWKKDNMVLTDADVTNYATTSDGEVMKFTTMLHLEDIQDINEARYQCVITNNFGSAYSQKAKITVHVFPIFTKTPVDIPVKAGSTARLECGAKGQPQPEIAWQKDGGDDFPAARERRMHVMPTDDVFFIVNVKSQDQGVYSCTATNAAGTIVANATVTVLETPSFVKAMEDKMTKAGATTVLECMASGSPKPKLVWLKNGRQLEVTQRHFFAANSQLLIIVQTDSSDAGQYTCEMTNALGMERDTTNLKVIGGESSNIKHGSGLDDESTTTGIIIIAVVCCVVGTSLVWVIIIYQTRKKSEEYSSTPTDETTLPGEMPSTPYHSSSDKEGSSSPAALHPAHHSTSFTNFHGKDMQSESPMSRGYGSSSSKVRSAAIFPSDVDDDDHRQSIPLTSDEQQPAEQSDNSIPSLHRIPRSDSDTIKSSTSLHKSSSSDQLQTFHPQPTNHDTLRASRQIAPEQNGGPGHTIVQVHSPNSNRCSPYTDIYPPLPIQDGHHGSQPPGGGTESFSPTFPSCNSTPVYSHSHSNHIPKDQLSSSVTPFKHRSSSSIPELTSPPQHSSVHINHLPSPQQNTDISLANQSEAESEDMPPTIPERTFRLSQSKTAPHRTFNL